ncbi:MAG: DNA polymerase III, subunit gamma and tau [candidate division NC10 bacterium RIFCSPLOWO2_12_FULL_66_18]|nr:MAG: DNA polymerase III, subunit gamma and tau [candidate division NC10 bacterium RIFCSPLOWO2_12_FULL_66_18]
MPYQVIARRWRPQAFDEVVGQRNVIETLKNAIATDRLAHALLFAGPRGVGKTTTARIVAKALNCDRGPTPAPCGRCGACEEITAGRSVDCLEVDAASNTQVEKTRDLLETVQYAPTRGRHKVYIIDEAHMLSTSSFNALLKTLEEPPPRVVFILATTEPHRIPATIQSRCQRHDFRLLGTAEIIGRLREIVAAEGVTVDEGTLSLLARAACGSLRDAQSLLDQAIASLGNSLEAGRVADLLGLVQADVLVEVTEAILTRDAARAIRLVDRLASHGQDLRQFTLELTGYLRDLAILRLCPEPGPLLDGARVSVDVARRQAERASLPELELMIKTLQQVEWEMRRAIQPRFLLEMALIRLAEIRHAQGLGEILGRLVAMEARLPAGPSPSPSPTELPLFGGHPTPPERPTRPAQAVETPPLSAGGRPPPEPAEPDSTLDVAAGWAATVGRLRGRKRLASVLAEVQSVGLEADTLTLEVRNGNAFVRDTLEDPETRRLIADAAAESFGRRLRIEYRFAAAPPPRLEAAARSAPAASPRVRDHPLVREALSLFGGTIVRDVSA